MYVSLGMTFIEQHKMLPITPNPVHLRTAGLICILWGFFSCSFVGGALFAQGKVSVFTNYQSSYELLPSGLIFRDPSHQMSIGDIVALDVSSGLSPITAKILSGEASYWVRLNLQNSIAGQPVFEGYLFPGEADYIDVYISQEDGTFLIRRTGALYPSSKKAISKAHHIQRVPLAITQPEVTTVWINYRSVRKFPVRLDLQFRLLDQLPGSAGYADSWGSTLFIGFLLAFFLFTLLISLIVKDPVFIFHSLFLGGVVLFLLDAQKWLHNFYLFAEFPWIKNYFIYGGLTLMDVGYLLFVRAFLNLGKYDQKWDAILLWVIRARLLFFGIISVAYMITLREPLLDQIFASTLILEYILIQAPFIVQLFRSEIPLRKYIILGTLVLWITAVVGSILFVFLGYLYLPLIFMGLGVEIVVFTLGLGVRYIRHRDAAEETRRVKELNAMKSDFLTNVTHEIRTPITVILGMVNRLNEARLRPQSKAQIIELIRKNSDQILNLVNQMLDLNKLDANAIVLEESPGDLVQFLRLQVASFEGLASNKDLRLLFSSDHIFLHAFFDPHRLTQIISNLLSNAIKYTPEGGEIVLALKRRSDREIQIDLQDTGSGIPERDLPYIFNRYYQSATHMKSGTGVGLALVKELVELMFGEIQVYSHLETGTTFSLILPYKEAHMVEDIFVGDEEKESVETIKKEWEELLGKNKKPTVLVVEDNPDLLVYLRTLLEKDYAVKEATNGNTAVEMAFDLIPDIMLCDVMLPGKDGFEVCKEVKENNSTSHVPIIMLTARINVEDRVKGYAHGADLYLGKPFHEKELLINIKKCIEQRKKILRQFKSSSILDLLPDSTSEGEAPDAFLGEVVKTIESHLGEENFGTQELARAMFMSRTQLHRKITAVTGDSASAIIRRIRMEKAVDYLKNSKHPIADIAELVGYKDASYFTKAFKKYTGKKPSELRNS